MKRTPLLAAACGFALATSTVLFAQNQQPAQPPAGLDALTDDKLIAELNKRGLTNLAKRAQEVGNAAPSLTQQPGAAQITPALKRLADPKLTNRQRDELIPQIVKAVEQSLPTLNDPKTLVENANDLLRYGVEREVSLLEYWGDSARSQVPLRPTVEAALKLLDKGGEIAQKQADALANAIAGPNDPKAKQWEQMANLAAQAKYTRHMADYYLALSIDRASPQRMEVAAKAAEYLLQFDNPESTVQPTVRMQIAKLHMVRDEFPQAKEVFATLIEPKDVQPPPDVWQQWEARYFTAVCDLLRGDPAETQKAFNELVAWQNGAIPKDKESQDRVHAAASMLQYRIHSLAAEKATTPDAKQKANEQAVAVLMDLVSKRPDLRSIIFRQLVGRLAPNADLKTLDPLLLQGIVVRADEERLRAEGETIDGAVIQRGVDAIREILRRTKAGEKIDPQIVDADALLLGFLLERIGQAAPAAEALLDYVRDFGGNVEKATLALDSALAIVGRLRADAATASQTATIKAYERVLSVAINPPFVRTEFAYEYARQLQMTGKAKEALQYFRLVPQTDKRYGSAQYFQMVALQQRLDSEKLPPAERQKIVAQLVPMADEVSKLATASMNSAANDDERLRHRLMLVRTLLVAADVARREQNDPKRTLQLLEQFEQLAKGLPNEQELVGNVLYTRVQSYMQLGDTDAATKTLVTLLKAKPGGEGASIVYNLLEKLNAELDAARASGQRERMQVLARNRAQLSGFLVQWARENADPNITKYTYRYSVFDASTKHLAADLEDDPAARQAGLQKALELFRSLESPASVELYRATLDPKSPERNYPDPLVTRGIGLIAFDLGDFAEAQRRLGKLLTDRKLGTPTSSNPDESGQMQVEHNDQYWEATLKLMRSNVALAAANAGDANAQAAKAETIKYLKELYVLWGRDVGGPRWTAEFEKLRAELIPDFNPDQLEAQTTQTTQPASSEAATR